MKPIRIYLDTSDYSTLISTNLSPELQTLKTQLQRWVDEEIIEIGYSFWTVTELIKPGSVEYVEKNREKGRLIKALTKGKCFPHPIDLKSGAQFPNDCVWMPRDVFKDMTAKRFLKRMADKAKTDQRFNRSMKRRLGTLSGVKQLLLETGVGDAITAEDFHPFRVSQEFLQEKHFKRLLLGEITDKKFQLEFMKSCCDPEHYFELWFHKLNFDGLIDEMVDKFHFGFSEAVEKLIESRIKAEAQYKVAVHAYKQYQKTLNTSELSQEVTSVLPPLEKPSKPTLPPLDVDFGQLARDFFPKNQTEYLNVYFKSFGQGRKPKRGDIGDLMHLQYIFNCDLFRCDDKMAKLFHDENSLPSYKIVHKLTRLSMRIEQLILDRTGNN